MIIMTISIYVLSGADGVRYVGQTVLSAEMRLRYHLTDAKKAPINQRRQWVLAQSAAGRLSIAVVRTVDRMGADEAERAAILEYRALGHDLLNIRAGGRGSINEVPLHDKILQVRVEAEERSAFQRAADLSGITVSEWVRMQLRQAAERRLANVGETAPWVDIAAIENILSQI